MQKCDKKLILASNSPRRKELLNKITSDFLIIKSNYDEELKEGACAYEYVRGCARYKAEDVFNQYAESIILAADTIVVFNENEILLKPQNEDEAFGMLKKLSGSWHKVITAVCIKTREKTLLKHKTSLVKFQKLSDSDILDYIKTGLPFDKAGSYGIQDQWARVRIERIKGCIDNIMGLPLKLTKKMLKGAT